MINLRLRQSGWPVIHSRVVGLYAQAKTQVQRRGRKTVPVSERQPLVPPVVANAVWSMDLIFGRIAGGRSLKCLTIDGDATQAVPSVQ